MQKILNFIAVKVLLKILFWKFLETAQPFPGFLEGRRQPIKLTTDIFVIKLSIFLAQSQLGQEAKVHNFYFIADCKNTYSSVLAEAYFSYQNEIKTKNKTKNKNKNNQTV